MVIEILSQLAYINVSQKDFSSLILINLEYAYHII